MAASPTPRCISYWKGSLLVALDYGRQLYYFIYIFSERFIGVKVVQLWNSADIRCSLEDLARTTDDRDRWERERERESPGTPCYRHDFIYTHTYIYISIQVRVFTNGQGSQASIPARVIPKTQKMVLDASLPNT